MVTRRQRLNAAEVEQALRDLPDWQVQDGKLHREFTFANFVEAFGFISRVAMHAEKLNHHPELCNVYNRVTVALTTHDLAGISNLDIELAKIIDQLAD